jgi:hypothetical protein
MAKTIPVTWKDTKEARRAVMDALPFLAKANEAVATIDIDRDGRYPSGEGRLAG